MEAVTNLASGVVNTASKVIWGDATAEKTTEHSATGSTEPLSGETGNVKQGEPYDKGNLPTPATEANPFAKALSSVTDTTTPATTTAASSLPETTSTTRDTKDTTASSSLPRSTDTTSGDIHSSSTLADTTTSRWKPESALPIRSEHETSKAGVESANNTSASHTNHSIAASHDPSTGAPALTGRPKGEHQAGQDPLAAPASEEERHATGNTGTYGTDESMQKGSIGEGTDRLLDKSGIHHDGPGSTTTSSAEGAKSSPGTPAKVSLKDKLKAKLHRHKDGSE